jgi:glycosyltransferase involved in cell wall biosynthesis
LIVLDLHMLSDCCKISVVIPTYNREKFVGRAIESVLNQTLRPAQIIVVDDGSTDGTAKVCDAYAKRVQYWWQRNAGAAAARNAGVRLARQPWVAFLDSDDYWVPSHLERIWTAICATAGAAGFYFSDLQLGEGDADTHWENIGFQPRAPWQLVPDATEWVLMKCQPTFVQSSVFSKRVWESVGGMDESKVIGEDSYLFCQLGVDGPACAVSGTGAVYPSDDRSNVRLTVRIPKGSEERLRQDCRRWRDVLRLKKLPPDFRPLVSYNRAASHLMLGKILWRSGRHLQAASHVFLAAKADPRLAVWLVQNGSALGYEEMVRPMRVEQPAAVPDGYECRLSPSAGIRRRREEGAARILVSFLAGNEGALG